MAVLAPNRTQRFQSQLRTTVMSKVRGQRRLIKRWWACSERLDRHAALDHFFRERPRIRAMHEYVARSGERRMSRGSRRSRISLDHS